ncbi:MAG: sugar transferase, partial [Dissulfurispiraceae bacterium]
MRINNGYKEIAGIVALVLLDTASFYVSISVAYFMRKSLNTICVDLVPLQFNLYYFILFWWLPVVVLASIAYEGLYTKRIPFWDETREMIKAVTIAVVVIFAVMSLGKFTHGISRLTIVLLYFCSVAVFPVMRLLGKKMLYRINIWKENLIIIGAGKVGEEVAQGIESERHLGYNIIGFLDDDRNKMGRTIAINNRKFKVFGEVKNFRKFLSLMDISTVVIAIPAHTLADLSKLIESVQRHTRRVLFVPYLRGIALVNTEIQNLSAQQMFMLKINNNLKSDFNRFIKRSFDFAFSLFLLPFLLIMVVIFGILITIDSRGSVFLVQNRIGKGGKIFKCVKFR